MIRGNERGLTNNYPSFNYESYDVGLELYRWNNINWHSSVRIGDNHIYVMNKVCHYSFSGIK